MPKEIREISGARHSRRGVAAVKVERTHLPRGARRRGFGHAVRRCATLCDIRVTLWDAVRCCAAPADAGQRWPTLAGSLCERRARGVICAKVVNGGRGKSAATFVKLMAPAPAPLSQGQ